MKVVLALAILSFLAGATCETTVTVYPMNVYNCASGQVNICMTCCEKISFKLPAAAVPCTQILNNNYFSTSPFIITQNVSLAYTYDGTSSVSFYRTGSGSAPSCSLANSVAQYTLTQLTNAGTANSLGVTMSSTGTGATPTTTAINCNSNQPSDPASTCSATPATCTNTLSGTCTPFTAKIVWYSFSAFTTVVPSTAGNSNSSSTAVVSSSAALAAAAAASALFLL
jgi:hypothetical protein